MVAYPIDYSPFTQKLDQIDVVLAEHINALQAELGAMQRVLGLNPQGLSNTVGTRIGKLETSSVTVGTQQTITGAKTFTAPVTFTEPVRLSSATPSLAVGPVDGENLAFDGTSIQALDGADPAPLTLNPLGGEVRIGPHRVLTQNDIGPAGPIDADTVDGYDASAFAAANHKHPQNFVQLTRTTGLAIPDGNSESDWHDVIFTNQSVHYKESGADMYTLNNGRFYTPPAVGPALYYFGVRLAFQKDSSVGTRRLRFIDSNGAIVDMMAEEANLMALDYISLSGMYYFPGTSNYWVKAQVYQDSGSTRSIYANSNTRPFQATWAAVMRGLN